MAKNKPFLSIQSKEFIDFLRKKVNNVYAVNFVKNEFQRVTPCLVCFSKNKLTNSPYNAFFYHSECCRFVYYTPYNSLSNKITNEVIVLNKKVFFYLLNLNLKYMCKTKLLYYLYAG